MKKFLYLKYILFSISILQADIIVTGAYTDTETNENHGWHTRMGGSVVDDRNPVHGYINNYTSITITVTLTDAPNSNNHGDRNTWMKVFLGFATERNVPANFITEDMYEDGEWTGDNSEYQVRMRKANTSVSDVDGGGVADYTTTWTITRDQIAQSSNFDSGSDNNGVIYVDFAVAFVDDENNKIAVDWAQNSSPTYTSLLWDTGVNYMQRFYRWRAAGWSGSENSTFSTQRLEFDPYNTLSSNLTSKIYIDNADPNADVLYDIPGDNLDDGRDTIIFDDNTFLDGYEYDLYYTIYDEAGNEYSWGTMDNITFDGTIPAAVINGYGETGGYFGPGNNPENGNAINDRDPPYYYTTDEPIRINFNWQGETMYRFRQDGDDLIKVNGQPWGAYPTYDADNDYYYITLNENAPDQNVAGNDLGAGDHIDGDGNTIITVDAGSVMDYAGNSTAETFSFTFRFDVTAPTLAITATRVGGDALSQSGLYNVTQDLKFTFTWTEQNRWANDLVAGDLTVSGFAMGNATFAEGNDNSSYTLTIPNNRLDQEGSMISVLVPTESVQDIGGLFGPAENTKLSFYFDRTAPTARVNTEESGEWNPLLDNIIVKGDNAGYGGDSAYVANGSHHGGILDNNAETYTITFDWNGLETGDELVPLDFGGGNITISGATEGSVTAHTGVSTTDYTFYGTYHQDSDVSNRNVYYKSSAVGGATWANQQTLALSQGIADSGFTHMMFIESENEHDFLFHIAQWINDSLWLGGTDATDEGTWLWEDGTASPDTFYLDPDNHDNGGPFNGLPSFWSSAASQPNNFEDDQDYVFYVEPQHNWQDNPAGETGDSYPVRTVLEVESEGVNKFTLPITSLQEGTVSIALTGFSDRAGNSFADATVHSFTYDISNPVFVSDDS
ncbi:hypothetical protein OAK14_00760, partial [Candidatus Marinimicrobia bacterium]|nr:hypothetical protein [Candidatus Neomarinimicrobiota bacterium]